MLKSYPQSILINTLVTEVLYLPLSSIMCYDTCYHVLWHLQINLNLYASLFHKIRYFSPKKLANQSLQTLYSYNSHHMYVDIRKKGKKALVSTKTIVNNLTSKNFHFKNVNKSMMSLAREKKNPWYHLFWPSLLLRFVSKWSTKRPSRCNLWKQMGFQVALSPTPRIRIQWWIIKWLIIVFPTLRIKQITLTNTYWT